MKRMSCPVHGPRPLSEFICWGKDRPEPPDLCTDEPLAEYVLNCSDKPGMATEWWCHRPSNTWFVAVRHLATGKVVKTLLPESGSRHGVGSVALCA